MYIGKQLRQKRGVLPGSWKQLYITQSLQVEGPLEIFPHSPHTLKMKAGGAAEKCPIRGLEVGVAVKGLARRLLTFSLAPCWQSGRENRVPFCVEMCPTKSRGDWVIGIKKKAIQCKVHTVCKIQGKKTEHRSWSFITWLFTKCSIIVFDLKTFPATLCQVVGLWFVKSPFISVDGILWYAAKSW